ncbi:glycosyltransferase involved in cell wall biosynthesis [Oxalobacteraceae bacterium GrIS 1.11]
MSGPRIAHIIGDLNGFGGTETTLLRYLSASAIPLSCHRVYVLKSIGEVDTLGAQMVAAGVSVRALNQRRGLLSLSGTLQLRRELRQFQPDVISAWLYYPCLLSALLVFLMKARPALVWHIRSLPYQRPFKKPGRFLVQKLLAPLSSRLGPLLVSNSRAAMRAHAGIGFAGGDGDWAIIHNGINAEQFYPCLDDRLAVRREWGLDDDAIVLGCVGRVVPEKAYPVFFAALPRLLAQLAPEIAARLHVVVIGNGAEENNPAFFNMACTGLPACRLHLLGKRPDVARLLRGFDVYILPSVSESFPNALVEAMASGLACVSTDAGECREVLGADEFVVRAGDAERLAAAMLTMVALEPAARAQIGARNRERAAELFVLKAMTAKFDLLFERAAAGQI